MKIFHLSPEEKRGMLVLLIVIAIVAAYKLGNDTGRQTDTETADSVKVRELEDFATMQRERRDNRPFRDSPGYAPKPFNPNTADSAEMVRCGLRPWQARNVIKYRSKGGVWRNADQFRKLYGLSEEDFRRIAPYLIFDESDLDNTYPTAAAHTDGDSLHHRFPKQEKFAAGTMVELNTADTTTLKHIPGIGSYFARKICEYRDRLGGFVCKEQVREIEGLPEDIGKWIKVEPGHHLCKLKINKASFRELIRHPYLNYAQTKSIVNYREKFGPLSDFTALRLDSNFSEKDFARLEPYIDWKK